MRIALALNLPLTISSVLRNINPVFMGFFELSRALSSSARPSQTSDVGLEVGLDMWRAKVMEKDIDRWLSFAARVENQLQTINCDVYSDRYIASISSLLNELRHAAAFVQNAVQPDKQEGYFRANELAQQLRNTAHFAHHG